MPRFDEDFVKSNGGPIKYNGMELIALDRIPVQKKFSGTLKIISTNSEWKQAVCLNPGKGGNLTIGTQKEKRFVIYADDFNDDVLHFEGTSKELQLNVYNAWEQTGHHTTPCLDYWICNAAMILEVDGNTRRYRCNDGHMDDNFDDIIFEITMDDEVLVNAKQWICKQWPKYRAYNPLRTELSGYDPLYPSKLNCRVPSLFNIPARFCYEMCARKWRTLKITILKVDVAFVPVWVCSNLSKKNKKNKWKLNLLLAQSDGNYAYVGGGNPNKLFVGTVEIAYVPYIEECRAYSEDLLIDMYYVCYPFADCGYFVDFAYVDSKVLEVKKMCEVEPEFEMPEIYVPPMCEKIMPAVRIDDLPETLQKLLKKEFDSDCSTAFKSLNWHLDYCSNSSNYYFWGLRKRPILPPEYKIRNW